MINQRQSEDKQNLRIVHVLAILLIALLKYHETREIMPTLISTVLFFIFIAVLLDEFFFLNAFIGAGLVIMLFKKLQLPGYFYYNAKIIISIIVVSSNMKSVLKNVKSGIDFSYGSAKFYTFFNTVGTFFIGCMMTDLVKTYTKSMSNKKIILIAAIYFLIVNKLLKLSNKLQGTLIIVSVVLAIKFNDYYLYPTLFALNLISNMIYYDCFFPKYKIVKAALKDNTHNADKYTSYGNSYSSSYKSSTSDYNSSNKTFNSSSDTSKYKDSSKSKSSSWNNRTYSHGNASHYDRSGLMSGYSSTDKHGNTSHYDRSGLMSGYSSTDKDGNTTHYDRSGLMSGYSSTDKNGNTTHYDRSGLVSGYSTTDEKGNTSHYDRNGLLSGYSD